MIRTSIFRLSPSVVVVSCLLTFSIKGAAEKLFLPAPGFQNPTERSYRIKPKDLLHIEILECACQCFGDTYEVDDHGAVRGLAFVPRDGIPAAGKTTDELTADIITELKKYLKNPKVKVAVAKNAHKNSLARSGGSEDIADCRLEIADLKSRRSVNSALEIFLSYKTETI